ncbi:hypothetical protein TSUD_96510 [Trifolium subterraneum]|nr:hypothetical protein TSUD_96510 [Trifolium subterraneum]
MIKKQKVEVIVGMHTWTEAASVSELVHEAQVDVPIISFVAPAITPPLMEIRWPSLVRLANNGTAYNPEEDNRDPGFYALQAYDSIQIIGNAIDRIASDKKTLLQEIVSSNFLGLSGKIKFESEQLLQNPTLRIVNVDGKSYRELDYWTLENGFFTNISTKEGENGASRNSESLTGAVIWPGKLLRVPKGWNLPTKQKPLRIAVPGRTAFSKFVKVDYDAHGSPKYRGFCIDIFDKVLEVLGYDLPYEYHAINGTYPDLVQLVYNKTYDAFLELPYEKVYISKYCKGYSASTPSTRFGGLGFMFQKGSPLARDVSKAILELLQKGELKKLEDIWLNPTDVCSNNLNSKSTESLKLGSFWILYVISGATSTICFLVSTIHSLKSSQTPNDDAQESNGSSNDVSRWKRVVKLTRNICSRKHDKTSKVKEDFTDSSSSCDCISTPEHHQQGMDVQLPEIITVSSPPTQL